MCSVIRDYVDDLGASKCVYQCAVGAAIVVAFTAVSAQF